MKMQCGDMEGNEITVIDENITYLELTFGQLNSINNHIQKWHLDKFSRLSPRGIEQTHTNLLFFDMPIQQNMQCQAVWEVLDLNCNIGDIIKAI